MHYVAKAQAELKTLKVFFVVVLGVFFCIGKKGKADGLRPYSRILILGESSPKIKDLI